MKVSERLAAALSVKAKVVPTGALLMCGSAEPRRHLLGGLLEAGHYGGSSLPGSSLRRVAVGAAAGPVAGATKVYLSAAAVSLVECWLLTWTSTVPAPDAGVVAVMCSPDRSTLNVVAGCEPNTTLIAESRYLPVIVTVLPAGGAARGGRDGGDDRGEFDLCVEQHEAAFGVRRRALGFAFSNDRVPEQDFRARDGGVADSTTCPRSRPIRSPAEIASSVELGSPRMLAAAALVPAPTQRPPDAGSSTRNASGPFCPLTRQLVITPEAGATSG